MCCWRSQAITISGFVLSHTVDRHMNQLGSRTRNSSVQQQCVTEKEKIKLCLTSSSSPGKAFHFLNSLHLSFQNENKTNQPTNQSNKKNWHQKPDKSPWHQKFHTPPKVTTPVKSNHKFVLRSLEKKRLQLMFRKVLWPRLLWLLSVQTQTLMETK